MVNKVFLALSLTLLFAAKVMAQDEWRSLPLPSGKYLSSESTVPGVTNKLLRSDASDNTEVNAPSGKAVNIGAAQTPGVNINNLGITFPSGKGVTQSVAIATLAATPAEGTNDIKKGFNILPTAAADRAAGLPSVPVAGDVFEGCNQGANTVRVKAFGTPGINGAAAGTYIPIATMSCFRCRATTATAYFCGTETIPTPAGP